MKTVAIVDQEAQQREAVQKVKRKPSLSERAKEATKNLMNKVLPPKKWPFNHPHINPHWGATEYVAWRLGFQAGLGSPWFMVLGWSFYPQPAFFW